MNNGRVYLAYFLRILLVVAIIASVIWLVYVTVQFAQGELGSDGEVVEEPTSQDEGANSDNVEVEPSNESSDSDNATDPGNDSATTDDDQQDEPVEEVSGAETDLPQTGPAETALIATILLSIVGWSWVSSHQQLNRAHTKR